MKTVLYVCLVVVMAALFATHVIAPIGKTLIAPLETKRIGIWGN